MEARAEPAASVQDFYCRNPFPDFTLDKYSLQEDLYRQANPYTLLLDAHVPLDARVLDLGCGTGQLACLLALKGRTVRGVDFSEASIEKARRLQRRLELWSVSFRLEDIGLARRADDEDRYDVILINGVLPCLPEPSDVLQNIVREFAAPGTRIVVGLYHSWGRLVFRLRRWLQLGSKRPVPASIHEMLVKDEHDEEKVRSWVADQITPPIEYCYKAREIRSWFDASGIRWVRSLPRLPGDPGPDVGLFEPSVQSARPGLAWRFAEALWAVRLWKTGGYFVTVGIVAEHP